MSFFVFIPAAATYYGAATVGAAVAGAIGVTGLSTVAISAIGAATISAGFTAARGGNLKDVLKSAVLSGATSYVGGSISKGISSTVRADAIMNGNLSFDAADTIGKITGAAASGAATGATRALLTGQDPIEALIKGGLTAGVGAGITEGIRAITSNIPGYDSLSDKYGVAGSAAQRAISASLAAGVLGTDVEDAVKNSILGSVTNYAGSVIDGGIKDLSSSIRPTYDNVEVAATKLQDNIDKQNQLVEEYNTRVTAAQAKQEELQANYDNYTRLAESGDIEGANALAKKLNDEVPKFEAETKQLDGLEAQLNATQKQFAYLENSYAVKKSLFDESVSNFQKQEEANAETIKKAFDDALSAKTTLEEAFGSELSQEQLDAIVKTGNPLKAAEDLKKSLEGGDANARKSVLDKLTEGVDSAVKYANENIVKTLTDAGLQEDKVSTSIGLDSDSAGQVRSLFANSQGALDKAADTTADTSDDYMADFLKSIGINTTEELRDSGLSNEDILRRINYTLEEGGDLDDWYKKIEDTTGLDEGPQIPTGDEEEVDDKGEITITGGRETCPAGTILNPETGECDPYWDETGTYIDDEKIRSLTGIGEPTTPVKDEGEVIIKGGRESCPVGTRLNLETGECDPYWDETGGDETDPTRDEGEVIIKGGRETCPPGTILNPMTGECDPYWDETGGDETEPTKPGPSTPRPTTPRPTTPRPTTPRPTTPTAPPTAAQPVAKQPAIQQIVPALLGMPQLADVFYYGKDFSSQKQELDPTGQLVPQEYDPLSVTQKGPELQLDKMGGTNENDVQALIQQIMASNNGDISPEELAQILGQQGNMYG